METQISVICDYKSKEEISHCKVFQQINVYFNMILDFHKLNKKMSMKSRNIFCLCLILNTLATAPLLSQAGYVPSASNLDAREWFQDAKFGLFVHWGVYSVMGGGGDMGIAEWIMERKQIPVDQYEKLPDFFNPVAFDPAEWVSMVKGAGMKYITITSKHHDGFAMYDWHAQGGM